MVSPLERDYVLLGRGAESAVDLGPDADAREEVLEDADVVAAHPGPEDPVPHVDRVAGVGMPADHHRRHPCPAAAGQGGRGNYCCYTNGASRGRSTHDSSNSNAGHDKPLLFRSPTGLAVGLALKEIALRRNSGDSPREALVRPQWVPRSPAVGTSGNSARSYSGGQSTTPARVMSRWRGPQGDAALWPRSKGRPQRWPFGAVADGERAC